MSELLESLKAKYPRYKVMSEPDETCTCRGVGERKIKPSEAWPNGHEVPCLCICISGEGRAEITRAVGQAAKRLGTKAFAPRSES